MYSQDQKKRKEERIAIITAIVLFSSVHPGPSDVLYSFNEEIVGYVYAQSQLHVQVVTSAV